VTRAEESGRSTATGASLELAIRKAYSAVDKIHFDGAHYRTDIGGERRHQVASRWKIDPLGEVLHLFQAIAHGEPVREFDEVHSPSKMKAFGTACTGVGGRQVLVTDIETSRNSGFPRERKENITTRGVAIAELQQGQRMRVGEALLEVVKPCTSCHLMDDIRDGLKESDSRAARNDLPALSRPDGSAVATGSKSSAGQHQVK